MRKEQENLAANLPMFADVIDSYAHVVCFGSLRPSASDSEHDSPPPPSPTPISLIH